MEGVVTGREKLTVPCVVIHDQDPIQNTRECLNRPHGLPVCTREWDGWGSRADPRSGRKCGPQ
jgi:hypothetical protein